jgi:uncharacterized membrane protein HdeD (DUF308 family)
MNISRIAVSGPDTIDPSRWWSIALRGAFAVIFGIIALSSPGVAAAALVTIFGIYAILDGITAFFVAARRGRAGQRWLWFVFDGLISIAAGVVALAQPGVTFLVLLLLVAIRAIALGAVQIGGALSTKGLDARWLWVLNGVLSVVFGFMLLSHPDAGGLAIVLMVGAYAIVIGVMTIAFGLHVHELARHEEPHEPHLGKPVAA